LFEFQRYGQGIVYPTTKENALQWAQHNGAGPDVLARLNTLPQRVAGPHEFLYALRRITPREAIPHPSSGRHPSYNWGASGVGTPGVPQYTYGFHRHTWLAQNLGKESTQAPS